MAAALSDPAFRELARMYGLQTRYRDGAGTMRTVSPEVIMAALHGLGADIATPEDAAVALQHRHRETWRRALQPVTVAWDGRGAIELRLPADIADARALFTVALESGEVLQWEHDLSVTRREEEAEQDGRRYFLKRARFPSALPNGYHELTLEVGTQRLSSLVIAAPRRSYVKEENERLWGVFLPLYALQSETSVGTGDFSDLGALCEWVGREGGQVVATLPTLAAFLDEPFDPSPYVPASRLFWNELYLDLAAIPELQRSEEAQRIVGSATFQRERAALRDAPHVDYRRAFALKSGVIEQLAATFFASPGPRDADYQAFLSLRPDVADYARFRAEVKRSGRWRGWRSPPGEPTANGGERYHLYAQWQAHEQMTALERRGERAGTGLYLDLPLGVHRDGYDTWREQGMFIDGVSVGAPPDTLFRGGQNWGFPPLHPERIREQGYRYLRDCLRHNLRHARVLRFDHVPGLRRQYWIPDGAKADEGVYIRYGEEEMFALLSLESHRHHAIVVGEDLGTVPAEVRAAMAKHRVHRTYVLQFELPAGAKARTRPPQRDSVASINTHDTPTFAGFWRGTDIDDEVELGLFGPKEARLARATRARVTKAMATSLPALTPYRDDKEREALERAIAFLGRSEARVAVINLEDLWGELLPQNTPGTSTERQNWNRKARYRLEAACSLPQVTSAARLLHHARKGQETA